MGDLLWLASYPKSGNTWMRILLSYYLGDFEQPAHINALEGGGINSCRDLLDNSAGLGSASLPPETAGRLRPEIYRVRHVVDAFSTPRLQAHEDSAFLRERLIRNTACFFRRGVAAGWQDELTPQLARWIEEAHREAMLCFGFLEPA